MMLREAKPYQERGWFVSRPSGEYIRLCRVEEGMTEAKRLLKVKLGELEEQREQLGGRLATKLTVTELFVLFLEDVEATKDEDTFRDYQRWCATGPDGVDVALKFLLSGAGHANAERKAFINLRSVLHSNLLALVDCWEADEWLVLGMELADRSLWDRLNEAKAAGLSGNQPMPKQYSQPGPKHFQHGREVGGRSGARAASSG
jgi:hypothetical protein